MSVAGWTLPAMRSSKSGPARLPSKPSSRLDLGRRGEDAAVARYEAAGYRVVARNWRCPLGELDLVLVRGPTLIFCEVKTRSGSTLGGGYEAVGWQKQRKLQHLAEAFLAASAVLADEVRFDVATVALALDGGLTVHVFESAF
jgi:putative endonuclease